MKKNPSANNFEGRQVSLQNVEEVLKFVEEILMKEYCELVKTREFFNQTYRKNSTASVFLAYHECYQKEYNAFYQNIEKLQALQKKTDYLLSLNPFTSVL